MTKQLVLDIFSPLPPLPTDIANHTAAVLAALQPLAHVRAWTSQEGPVELDLPDVDLRRYHADALPLAVLNEADATFFNLGNNARFHRDIHAASRRVPGIVVLHDTRLQHFFAAYTEHDGPDRRYYLDLLERTYGSAVRVMGEEFIEQRGSLADLIEAAPMTLPALDNAVAAILHNAEEQTLLAQQTYIPTYYVPLSFRFDAAPDKPQNRDRNAPSRLIMFGFIGENRRLLPVLQALASMSDREDYRLDIYGVVEQQEAADAYVAESGLANLVSFHGFVPEPTLNMALEGADLALNLRWPSMGEASGSQLRIWASALPSLVTRTEWYAQLPAGTVFMIDQAEESVQIVRHLRALRTTPELFAAAGRRGRYVLESQHAPSRYAEALVEIAAAHSGQHLRRSGQALARRSAEVLLELTGAELARPLGWEIGRRIADLTGGK